MTRPTKRRAKDNAPTTAFAREWSKANLNLLVSLANGGIPPPRIAERLGCSLGALRLKAKGLSVS
jgi:hypothetical protein